MRECSDCRENDRSFSFSLYYKCQNNHCENYSEPLCIVINVTPTPLANQKKTPKHKIDEYFSKTYVIKNRTHI